ncbi:MAG: porin family protein [Bacteroidetes bacterium]|nr:porin family protein [Bacteroidota bacterium]
MKKILLSVVAIIALSLSTEAQKGFHAGIQGAYYGVGLLSPPTRFEMQGGTFSAKKNKNPYTNFDMKYGSSVGLAIGYGFIPSVGIQVELNTSSMGNKSHGTAYKGAVVTREIDLTYTQVPVLLKFRPGNDGVVHSYFYIGPEFHFLTSASVNAKDSTGAQITPYSPKDKGHFTTKDVGLAFGTGADFVLPAGIYFNLGVRIYYGFSDLNDPSYRIPSDPAKVYTASTNASAGLNLGVHYKF